MAVRRSIATLGFAALQVYAASGNTIHNTATIDQQQHDNPSNEMEQSRRKLFPEITAYFDPSDVKYKPIHQLNFPVHHGISKELEGQPRPLNILSIGSEHTSGATLENQYDAYPYLIGHPFHNHVDVLSFRPSSADFPAMCLESVSVRGDYRAGYDLILLDFNLNGSDGLPLLVKRLRERYPDAVIIYVGLWSLMTGIEEEGTGQTVLQIGHDTSRNWVWKDDDFYVTGDLISKHGQDCTHEICTLDKLKEVMETYGGYVYEFPRPKSPDVCITEGWFNDRDWHHLSETGHRVLSNSLIQFLDHKYDELFNNYKKINPWQLGDQCYNWMQTGNNPLTYSGAEMKDLLAFSGTDVSRWALIFDDTSDGTNDAGEIIIDSKFDVPVPAGLAYFSRADPADFHIVEVTVNGMSPVTIDPSINKSGVSMTGVTMLTYSHIGDVQPGKNIIKITTKEKRKADFQVTGVYLCGACAEDGHLGQGAANFLSPLK